MLKCKNCGKDIPRDSKQTAHCNSRCRYEFHHVKWKKAKRITESIKDTCCECGEIASTYYKTTPLCKIHFDKKTKKARLIRYLELKAKRQQ